MKQINITLLLTVLMSMVGVSVSAYDIEVKNGDNATIYYNYINNKTELEVTYNASAYYAGYYENVPDDALAYSGNVVIPASVTYNGKTYSVTRIGSHAFVNCNNLKAVFLPSSITSIGYEAFANCEKHYNNPGHCLPNLTDIYFASSFLPKLDHYTTYYVVAVGWTEQKNIYDSFLFGIIQPNQVTLHVPSAAISKYRSFMYNSLEFWNCCKEIVPMEHTLKYVVDGETYKSEILLCGEKTAPVTPPMKEGYTFSSWEGLPLTMPDEDVTVTATYVANKYSLTYKVEGQVYKTAPISYGATIIPEPAPEKKFYTFSGWSEIPETMPAHDVEITGHFIYKKGDASGDGQITANDIVLISQYIMGNTTDINVEAADANGDGQVTANDIVFLAYYILHGTFPEK